MTEALDALRDEVQALSAVLRGLVADQFGRLTNCPPWDLRELVVHTGASIRVTDSLLRSASMTGHLSTAADYYRRPERSTTDYRQGNVDRTRELALTAPEATALPGWFDEVSARTVALLEEVEPRRVIHVPGQGLMVLEDWVVTRVVSVAAHGVDVAITLGREPWTTPSALGAVRPVYVDLLGMSPPDVLGWNDLDFLVAGSGRRDLNAREREILGDHGRRFPLLS